MRPAKDQSITPCSWEGGPEHEPAATALQGAQKPMAVPPSRDSLVFLLSASSFFPHSVHPPEMCVCSARTRAASSSRVWAWARAWAWALEAWVRARKQTFSRGGGGPAHPAALFGWPVSPYRAARCRVEARGAYPVPYRGTTRRTPYRAALRRHEPALDAALAVMAISLAATCGHPARHAATHGEEHRAAGRQGPAPRRGRGRQGRRDCAPGWGTDFPRIVPAKRGKETGEQLAATGKTGEGTHPL